MAWGGGGAGWDGFGAGDGRFGGIPVELQERVDRLERRERQRDAPVPAFSMNDFDRRPFSLRRFLAPHRAALAWAFAVVVVETAMITLGPFLMGKAVDDGIRAQDRTALARIAALYVGTVLVGGVASFVRITVTGRIGARLLYEVRVRLFSHFQRLSLDFFTREKAGVLMSRMTSDLEALQQLFTEGLVNLAVQGLMLVALVAFLIAIDAALALVVLVAILPGMLALTLWFRHASSRGFNVVRDRIAEVLAHLQESISGIRIITAHNRRLQNIVEHRTVLGRYRDANDYTAHTNAVYGPGSETLGLGSMALLVGVGGWMVLHGRLTIGELTAFVLYLQMFFAPIQQLVQLYGVYQQGQASIRKLGDAFAQTPSVPEDPGAAPLPPVQGTIRLEDVAFAYPTAPGETGEIVLSGVDLEISAGETFALVGPTGAGKSTIAKLVARFYDPASGRVLIDGHDLRTVTFHSLRGQLGVVPQEPFLFSGSIRDNIAFARPDATDEDVLAACEAVGIDDLVARLPDGLDTPCHERGVTLSSGERQLLALARAFLARPRVLVLDEATSNLDLRSEAKIERALDVLLEGRTAIVIAHRLQTAMRADRIAVIDGGRIVEIGSHDALVALGGRYAAMYATWRRQAGPGEAADGPAAGDPHRPVG
jgi:ATP-binding cassette subfamily B protein